MTRRVTTTDICSSTAWLTGLVQAMDAVTHGGACTPIDPALRDRFAAHLRQPKSLGRIPLAPDAEEARAPSLEHVRS